MDGSGILLHYPGMDPAQNTIPTYDLYGETVLFPDIMHCERIGDRARGLDWRIPPHRHGILHQFFHLAGTGARVSMDGGTEQIDREVVISVPRFVAHGFQFPRGQKGHVLSVLPDTLPDLFGETSEAAGALAEWRMVDAPPGMAGRFEAILDGLNSATPLRNAVLKARVVEIAAAILSGHSGDHPLATPDPAQRYMRRFEALIASSPPPRRRVDWYAARIGISPEHLGRITRALAGTSPARLVEERAMQEARRQLAYTRMPINAIAFELGYEDPAYFSRAFRRCEGVSPKAYRASRSGAR